MREAQVHDQVGALLLAAQTNTDDLQLLLIAVDDTVHHVGDVGAGQAMQAACFGLVIGAGNQNLIALDLDGHQVMIVGIQAALGALDGDGMCCLINSDRDTGRNDDGFSSNSRHCLLPLSYHTKARTSPPTCAARAALSVMMPLEVEMIAVPRPFMTLGISSQLV